MKIGYVKLVIFVHSNAVVSETVPITSKFTIVH